MAPLTLEQQNPPAHVIVYICPTKGCGNYYGNTTFRKDRTPDIDRTTDRRGQDGQRVTTHARTECPDCRARGVIVQRVPYLVTAVIPLDAVVQNLRDNLTKREKDAKRAAKEATA